MGEEKLAERVRHLEESQAFAERAIDQVGAEMGEMQKRLAELTRRVARLEAAETTRGEESGGDEADPSGQE